MKTWLNSWFLSKSEISYRARRENLFNKICTASNKHPEVVKEATHHLNLHQLEFLLNEILAGNRILKCEFISS